MSDTITVEELQELIDTQISVLRLKYDKAKDMETVSKIQGSISALQNLAKAVSQQGLPKTKKVVYETG